MQFSNCKKTLYCLFHFIRQNNHFHKQTLQIITKASQKPNYLIRMISWVYYKCLKLFLIVMGLGISTKSYKVRILREIYIQLAWLYKITSCFPNKTVLKSCEVMYTKWWMNLERWYPFWHFLLLDLTMLDLHKNHLYVGQWHQQNKNPSLKRSVKWNGLNAEVSGWSSWKIKPSTEPQRTEHLPVNLILKLFFLLWMTGKLWSTWLLCLDTIIWNKMLDWAVFSCCQKWKNDRKKKMKKSTTVHCFV